MNNTTLNFDFSAPIARWATVFEATIKEQLTQEHTLIRTYFQSKFKGVDVNYKFTANTPVAFFELGMILAQVYQAIDQQTKPKTLEI